LAKLFPGVLLIVLAAQRRWRALAWTGAWLSVFVLLSVIVLGPAPLFEFFQVQLGRLASGEAFPAMTEEPRVMAANMSVHGLIWKLGVLAGAPSPLAARIVSAVFTVALLVGVAVAARRRPDRLGEAQLWLAVLFLGALCGPFSPEPYALLALLWL